MDALTDAAGTTRPINTQLSPGPDCFSTTQEGNVKRETWKVMRDAPDPHHVSRCSMPSSFATASLFPRYGSLDQPVRLVSWHKQLIAVLDPEGREIHREAMLVRQREADL